MLIKLLLSILIRITYPVAGCILNFKYKEGISFTVGDLKLFNWRKPAILALVDGSFFFGSSIGSEGITVGEVIFNTAMTGYQEILTDPSYAEQIVTFTYPHIGNVGVNSNDLESYQIWVAGLIIRELSPIVSNWRAKQPLDDYLKTEGIVAIAGIDTRRLTRLIREQGVLHGCIMAGETIDADEALHQARAYSGLKGKDFSKSVSTKKIKTWMEGMLDLSSTGTGKSLTVNHRYSVLVYDYGLKRQIVRLLVSNGCSVTIVPAKTSIEAVLNLKPDGIVLSNGPGDPADCGYAIATIQQFLEREIPLLGICLGFQLLALACGGKTKKMKFGHHGANHPVQNIEDGRVFITSQNHSFALDEVDLPEMLRVTHRSLFDGTLQGIAHKTKPAIAFQGHPEASPGPQDMQGIFENFIQLMQLMKEKCRKEPI